jgi:hypothetical protein
MKLPPPPDPDRKDGTYLNEYLQQLYAYLLAQQEGGNRKFVTNSTAPRPSWSNETPASEHTPGTILERKESGMLRVAMPRGAELMSPPVYRMRFPQLPDPEEIASHPAEP